MPKTSEETQPEILNQFDRGDVLEPGPLRWVRRASTGPKLMLQQQWKGPVCGKRIWVDVPVDEEE